MILIFRPFHYAVFSLPVSVCVCVPLPTPGGTEPYLPFFIKPPKLILQPHTPPFHDIILATLTIGPGRCYGKPNSPHRTPRRPGLKTLPSALITITFCSSWCFLLHVSLSLALLFWKLKHSKCFPFWPLKGVLETILWHRRGSSPPLDHMWFHLEAWAVWSRRGAKAHFDPGDFLPHWKESRSLLPKETFYI